MSRAITAAVLRHPEQPFQLEQLRLPEPAEDQILVRVVASGMCHTDLMPRQPGSFVRPPIVVGHEGAGSYRLRGNETERRAGLDG